MMQQMLLGYGPSGLKIDDVFAATTYTGNGTSDRSINNGLDLDGEGGIVWIKSRNLSQQHILHSTDFPNDVVSVSPNTNNDYQNHGSVLTGYNSNGWTMGNSYLVNGYNDTYVAWSFLKAAKFFDVVTYSGNGTSGRTISHNLDAVPGMIWIKCVNDSRSWRIYHSYLGNTKSRPLNENYAPETNSSFWNNTTPTSSVFTLGNDNDVNASGKNYVAFLFAEDTSGIIKCGGYVGNGGWSNTITTGFETQFLFVNRSELGYGDYHLYDTARGMTSSSSKRLEANTGDVEANTTSGNFYSTSTGFVANNVYNVSDRKYMYMAIAAP